MVQFIQLVLTFRLVVHTVRVEAERLVARIDGNREWTVLEQGQFEGIRITGRYVHPAGDRCIERYILHPTVTILAQVLVLILHGYATDLHDPLVGPEVFATIAPIVTVAPRAIDQRLLREADQFLRLAEVGTLDVTDRTERPAGTAHGLILDGRHGTADAPIPAVW
uniref:Putative secreted peptide n=1 Tax=Anopheles braziliensis TaxID=58242 RepID=A0A2M3ZNP2_9DIPT